MSKEFIEKRVGNSSLRLAERQQNQLSYFLTSEVQEIYHIQYFESWAERNYQGQDAFLNWIKGAFKPDNFMSFCRYYRNPNPSARLIHTRIKEPLSRVFFSEDSYFRYTINGQSVDHPEELEDDFQKKLFDALLFRHNDIVIHDLSDINTPYRKFLGIDKVVSIEVDCDTIERLSYTAMVEVRGEVQKGYAYLDAEKYCFYDKDYKLLINVPHDLGKCPATFVSKESFGNDPVVRLSPFSYLRADLEEYAFLKTLQKMTEPNGAIPIAVTLQTKEVKDEGDDFDGLNGEPMSALTIGSQRAKDVRKSTDSHGSQLQVGTIVKVPAIEKNDGSIDMDLVKNYFSFYYTPIEALEYLKKRLTEIEQGIITAVIGDHSEGNEMSMTEKQVQKTFVSREDKLRWLSDSLSWARQHSDFVMLALAHGKESVIVDTFYGSDFFWETPDKLYEMFSKAPNGIERKNILTRLAKRRNMFNKEKARKEVILYKIMPYASDKDFEAALGQQGAVDENTFQLQTRFDYWISLFEAKYGSIVSLWNNTKASESEKILLLNNLLINLIQENGKEVNRTA